ncbi:MAG: hypothetical protein ABL962_07625, partial [Fimbriimonadaceae bacterium]
SGLGAFEGVLDYLYQHVSTGGAVVLKGQGLMAALTYLAITIAIAVVSCVFYLEHQKEVSDAIRDAEGEAA